MKSSEGAWLRYVSEPVQLIDKECVSADKSIVEQMVGRNVRLTKVSQRKVPA